MHKSEISLGGRALTIETGKWAKQADGSVIVRMGDTMVLVTACHAGSPREGIDFLPLTVDYREYTYSSGRIPGGFFKREGKATEKETLTSRLIDRPIRPLFPTGWAYETQVIAFVLSADTEHDSDVLAITGASAALALSEMPLEKTDRRRARRPRRRRSTWSTRRSPQRKLSRLDLTVAGSKDGIVMVEAGANEVSEEEVIQALEDGARRDQGHLRGDRRHGQGGRPHQGRQAGRDRRRDASTRPSKPTALAAPHRCHAHQGQDRELRHGGQGREGNHRRAARRSGDPQGRGQGHPARPAGEGRCAPRFSIASVRLDGRKFDEIRPITIETKVLPRVHGSAVFTRGETQALVTATLGTSDDQQKIEMVEGETWKRFMLHYNFPPFSVGEVKPMRGPGRREIGHGALAERALAPMMPAEADFAYTVRIVSDILESNGSSSMASVCGASLAMMDAGVPIKAPVAGVAMGLIMDEATGKYAVLSDIAGAEDHYGDMDFKVAGTADGITALQMDIKVTGISAEVMRAALTQARAGRLHILQLMQEALPATRTNMSAYAPRIVTIKIPVDKIRDVIGPGGKMIRCDHRAHRRQDRRRRTTARSTWRRRTKPPRPRPSASSRS